MNKTGSCATCQHKGDIYGEGADALVTCHRFPGQIILVPGKPSIQNPGGVNLMVQTTHPVNKIDFRCGEYAPQGN